MRTLVAAAHHYVIIYASNSDDNREYQGPHIKHRQFSTWIQVNAPEWELLEHIPNRYPYRGDYTEAPLPSFSFTNERRRRDPQEDSRLGIGQRQATRLGVMLKFLLESRLSGGARLACWKLLKLHIGCGIDLSSGWVNVDLFEETADLRLDLRESFPPSTASGTIIHQINHLFHEFEEHKYAYDEETLPWTLRCAGFEKVSRCRFDLAMDTERRRNHTMYASGIKPAH